jgi:hypothetical protein
MRTFFTTLAVTIVALACPRSEAAPPPDAKPPADMHASSRHADEQAKSTAQRDIVDADGVIRRGSALTPDLELTPVSVAVAKAKDLDGKRVKLSGTVESVCQPMGCWFVVQGAKPEDKVRISAKAHNIFVPKSAAGMSVVVEGVITLKTLDQKTAQHYEDERALKPGETRKTFSSDVTELAIDVAGLEMKKS